MKKSGLLLLFIFPLFYTCEINSGCRNCQDAIEHMGEKISNYSCNPYFMQNAWDKITNECGAMADTYVGYMAETCNQGNIRIPECSGSLSAENIKIAFYSITEIPEDLDITIQFSRYSGSDNLRYSGTYIETELSGSVQEDDEITISIYTVQGLDPELTETKKFTFARNGNWYLTRGVQINYIASTRQYFFVFDDWGDQF